MMFSISLKVGSFKRVFFIYIFLFFAFLNALNSRNLNKYLKTSEKVNALNKIELNNQMIFDYYYQFSNAQKLIDEQNIHDPIDNPSSVPTEFWGADFTIGGSEYVSFNLQGYYHIDAIILHDGGGLEGNIKIQMATSPNGPWTDIINYNTDKFNDWIRFDDPTPNSAPTKYIRIEASSDDAVAIGELFIYGTLDTDFNPDILPGVGKNARITTLSCTAVTLEWENPFDDDIKEYQILGGPQTLTKSYTEGIQTLEINDLSASTTYNFSIITIDNANQASATSLDIQVRTYEADNCDLNCNLFCACAICIRDNWITNLTPLTTFEKANLVDEQNKVPFCEADGADPTSFWEYNFTSGSLPAIVEINLQEIYNISKCHFYFQGGTNQNFTVAYKTSNNQWIDFISHNTSTTFGWKTFDNLNIQTQYIRLTQPDPNSSIGEIGICGTLSCPSVIDLANNINESGNFKAQSITSSAVIAPNIDVTFSASDHITLTNGFHVKTGATFQSKIEACPSQSSLLVEEIAYKPTQSSKNLQNRLLFIHPNPFRGHTTLTFDLEKAASVQLDIYNPTGKKVKTLIKKQYLHKGRYSITYIPTEWDSGFYLSKLNIDKNIIIKKMIIIK